MGIHGGIISQIFKDRTIGSDLEFADIKTNKQSSRPKIYCKVKDFLVNFWIIWDFVEENGYVVNVNDFKKLDENKIATSIYMKEIKQKAIFRTNDMIELKKFYYEKIEGKINE